MDNASAPTGLLDDSLIAIDSEAGYQLWALIIMQGLMLLERIFKNSKMFCRCNKDGCTLTNRTPPISPNQSQAIARRQSDTERENINMADVMKALEKIKESQDSISASISGSPSAVRDKKWKKRKETHKEESSDYE